MLEAAQRGHATAIRLVPAELGELSVELAVALLELPPGFARPFDLTATAAALADEAGRAGTRPWP